MSGKNKDILFVGYDFEQKYYRGISFYAQTVISVFKDLGYNNYLLTSSENIQNNELIEFYIKKKIFDPTYLPELSKKKKLLILLKDILGTEKTLVREQETFYLNTEKLKYLDRLKGFVNKPYFYNLEYFRVKQSMEPCKLNVKEMDCVFTTAPIYIKSSVNKVIQSLHDIIPILSVTNQLADDPSIFYNRIKTALDHSDAIVSVSEFSKNELLKVFPEYEKKIFVTHQPVPVFNEELKIVEDEILSRAVLNSNRLTKGEYLLYFGFLEKRKNIAKLIQAYMAVQKQLDIPLVLAGKIDENDEDLKKIIKRESSGKNPKVIYLGYINNIEKLILLKNARAFVFPSIYEGFGLPPIEAFNLNTPVLTSNVASLPEVCGNAAVYVNPFDLNSLVQGLLDVSLNDSIRKEKVENGRKQVKLFTPEKYSKRISNVISAI